MLTVQDESSQLVAHILGARSGEMGIDVCSAPGGKNDASGSNHAEQRYDCGGRSLSQKLKLVDELAQRLGITIIHTIEGDARNCKESRVVSTAFWLMLPVQVWA